MVTVVYVVAMMYLLVVLWLCSVHCWLIISGSSSACLSPSPASLENPECYLSDIEFAPLHFVL